ncbi:MAG: UDP-N-acetylglucosamine 2-epimerase (non-hydrolyzing) [Bacteroidetes bacterium]|nr:MAG: UDP-N-acetylglucosamine 2-epimerase (non-hydrolyzing) [Bacteroidota bacterium]
MIPKILFVVGARPNFIKVAPLSKAVANEPELDFRIVHTGQHYDDRMSDIFFKDLHIPTPDYHLKIGSDTHAKQTARMMIALEDLCLKNSFCAIIVIGDVNSTLAGALVGAKLNIPTVHVEAGLRSYNRQMPEEINRIATDHITDLLFAPTNIALKNLQNEGLAARSWFSGDVMYDMVLTGVTMTKSEILEKLKVKPQEFYLSTLHRPYNVDNPDQLQEIINALSTLDKKVVLAAHPRLRQKLQSFKITPGKNIILTQPLGYLEFITLEKNAAKVITDSGGVQKEAFFLETPCVTLRPETEWTETTFKGANVLVKERTIDAIRKEVLNKRDPEFSEKPFGDGHASEKIIEILKQQILN